MNTCDDGLRVGRKFKFVPGSGGARYFPETYRISKIVKHPFDREQNRIYWEPLKGRRFGGSHNLPESYLGKGSSNGEWMVIFVDDHNEFTDAEYEGLLV